LIFVVSWYVDTQKIIPNECPLWVERSHSKFVELDATLSIILYYHKGTIFIKSVICVRLSRY